MNPAIGADKAALSAVYQSLRCGWIHLSKFIIEPLHIRTEYLSRKQAGRVPRWNPFDYGTGRMKLQGSLTSSTDYATMLYSHCSS
jgi:hypothetical protein